MRIWKISVRSKKQRRFFKNAILKERLMQQMAKLLNLTSSLTLRSKGPNNYYKNPKWSREEGHVKPFKTISYSWEEHFLKLAIVWTLWNLMLLYLRGPWLVLILKYMKYSFSAKNYRTYMMMEFNSITNRDQLNKYIDFLCKQLTRYQADIAFIDGPPVPIKSSILDPRAHVVCHRFSNKREADRFYNGKKCGPSIRCDNEEVASSVRSLRKSALLGHFRKLQYLWRRFFIVSRTCEV